jgi:hypothetical protein
MAGGCLKPDQSRDKIRPQPLQAWLFVITASALKWSSTFFEAPALTTQSISTGASMRGLAMLINRCRAIDSMPAKGLATHAAK